MVTKYGKVQIVEKRELERLIKCERERKRQHIFERLDAFDAETNAELKKLWSE